MLSLWSHYNKDLLELFKKPGYTKGIIMLWNTEIANIPNSKGIIIRAIPCYLEAEGLINQFNTLKGYQWRLLDLLRNHNINTEIITEEVLTSMLKEACIMARTIEIPTKKNLSPFKC